MRQKSAVSKIIIFIGLSISLCACQLPLRPAGKSGAAQGNILTAGGSHTCKIENGAVKCWGANAAGQLGDGTFADKPAPTKAAVFSGSAVSVSAGFQHTCALTGAGQVACWGDNWAGQLGGQSGGMGGFTAVAAGGSHTCALTSAGGIRCWGGNKLGALGNGTNQDSQTPVDVLGLASGVQSLAAGMDFSCAVIGNRAKCWGADDSGQLGNGSYESANQPVEVSGLPKDIAAVAVGFFHACALTKSGDVWCWGENTAGELGDGTNTGSSTPVQVTGLSGGAAAIAVGGSHTCVLTKAGGVKCWGDNSHGQLGDGTTVNRNAPVDVTGMAGGVTVVVAGGNHTCAMISGGAVKCWGSNASGELGDGTTTDRNTPVAVVEPSGG